MPRRCWRSISSSRSRPPILCAGVITAVLGTLIIFPSFRLRGHYVTIATLGIGEIVTLVILNWDSLTRGPIGLTAIPPLVAVRRAGWSAAPWVYGISLARCCVLALLQYRLLGSHLGRTLRAIRDDDVAARCYGIALDRYKAWPSRVARLLRRRRGAIMAHIYSYINHETFNVAGLDPGADHGDPGRPRQRRRRHRRRGAAGRPAGAVPRRRRVSLLIYGIVLLLLIRFRPQGLLGTV